MDASTREEATRLLGRIADGDARAAGDLFPLVLAELHELARKSLQGREAGHTLQPTALVNEAYVRLVASRPESGWNGRVHFLAVAAKAMRCVLLDHARAKSALRRGGAVERVSMDELLAVFEERSSGLLALDAALEKLTAQDAELGRLVELRFFGGMSMAEVAQALGTSLPTAERRWRVARLWLQRELGS